MEPVCGNLGEPEHLKSGTFMRNLGEERNLGEPWGTFMWNLGEPELLRVEPGYWNLVEPELATAEPVCRTRNLAEPGPRFRAAAPNHPEALLEEPQASQAVGEKSSAAKLGKHTIEGDCCRHNRTCLLKKNDKQ